MYMCIKRGDGGWGCLNCMALHLAVHVAWQTRLAHADVQPPGAESRGTRIGAGIAETEV